MRNSLNNNYNNIPNSKFIQNNNINNIIRGSKDTINIQASNDTIAKKKKKRVHPNEVLNKILRSNSKTNLDNSLSQNRSFGRNSNNYDENNKNFLSDLNKNSIKNSNYFQSNNNDINNNNLVIKTQNKNNNQKNSTTKINENIKNNFANVISEENSENNKNSDNLKNFTGNDNKSISKNTVSNNTEDYIIKGNNNLKLTNDVINQLQPNNINGNITNESI